MNNTKQDLTPRQALNSKEQNPIELGYHTLNNRHDVKSKNLILISIFAYEKELFSLLAELKQLLGSTLYRTSALS
jgi:hypothetical protein